MKPAPNHPGKHIDPATAIWPIAEWGSSCGRGFVSNERFARSKTETVLKRANRKNTKRWYRLGRSAYLEENSPMSNHGPELLDPGDPRAPKYWMYETSGVLKPVIEAFLAGTLLTPAQVRLMQSYLYQWVNSPVWAPDGAVEALRLRVAAIKTHRDVVAAIDISVQLGMDPL